MSTYVVFLQYPKPVLWQGITTRLQSGVVRCGECVEKMMLGLHLWVDNGGFGGMQFSAFCASGVQVLQGCNNTFTGWKEYKINCIKLYNCVFAAIRTRRQPHVWYCFMQITQSHGKNAWFSKIALRNLCLPQVWRPLWATHRKAFCTGSIFATIPTKEWFNSLC